jgi:hypothetical protein
MSMPLELLIYIGLFAVSLGLVSCFLGDTDNEKRRLRAAHASRHYARRQSALQPVSHRRQ